MFTVIIILINIAIFIAINKGKINTYDLAASYDSVFNYKRYHKIISSGFTHEQISHLFFNMFSLYNIGTWAEAYYGSIRYLLMYLIILVLGQTISLIAKHNNNEDYVYSIGASGAICGLIGIYFVKMYLYFGIGGIMQMIPSIVPMIIMSMMPGVDKTGHLYGFIIGGIIGFLM